MNALEAVLDRGAIAINGFRMNIRLAASVLAIPLLAFCSSLLAAADGSQFALPRGAKAAIVVFEDLQCPDCAQAHPELLAAAKANKVPLLIHDFPITRHAWAFPAAVLAGYFTARSPDLGVEFRSFIFQNQKDINPGNLRQYAENFAQDHHLQLPPDVDADGKLKDKVQADFDLGNRIGLEYVPLMFVIGRGEGASHFVEVTDVKTLGEAIARMKQGPAK
jgi:protein-disulfide isomerase